MALNTWQGIGFHKDGPLYSPTVAVLSLGSAAVFEFRSSAPKGGAADAPPPVASLLLPVRPCPSTRVSRRPSWRSVCSALVASRAVA